jgi:hypothetical protein
VGLIFDFSKTENESLNRIRQDMLLKFQGKKIEFSQAFSTVQATRSDSAQNKGNTMALTLKTVYDMLPKDVYKLVSSKVMLRFDESKNYRRNNKLMPASPMSTSIA